MSTTPKIPGLNADEWREKLAAIGKHLRSPASLCLIGSGPGILSGQPNRVSIDLDSWQKASQFAYSDLKQACEKAGLVFNPKDEIDPNQPYIQIVEQGLVQVGRFKETTEVLREGQLIVERVPFENIVASKMVLMREKDIEDVAYIANTFGVTKKQVEGIIRSFPEPQRTTAMENLIYMDIIAPPKRPALPTPVGVGLRGACPAL